MQKWDEIYVSCEMISAATKQEDKLVKIEEE